MFLKYHMKKLANLFFFLFSIVLHAQAPAIDWMKRYGGSSTDLLNSLIITQDGGFLMGGSSNSGISGIKTEERIGYNQDYWVIKTDNLGAIEWQKTIGAGNPNGLGDLGAEVLRKVRQAADGGYFLGGNSDSPAFGSKTEPNYGGQDYWIVKINSSGTIVWQKDIGGTNEDECFALEATPDGGCIAGGYSRSGLSGNKTDSNRGLKDYWVVKLDANGQIQWQKSYGGASDDILYSILALENQEYILVGASASNISGEKTENSKGGGDFWIIKIDASGNIIWQKTIGGNSGDIPYNAVKLVDGFVFSGVSYSNISFDKTENSRGGADYWMLKTDFNGNVLWDKTIGGGLDEFPTGLMSMEVGSGFVLAGTSYSDISGDKTVPNYGDYNGWVIRTNQNGELLWQKGIGGSYTDAFNQVVELPDHSVLLGGGASSTVSGNLTAEGYGGADYWLVKLEQEQLGTDAFSSNAFSVYPNPTPNDINISFVESQEKLEVAVYNSLLQLINTFKFNRTSFITMPINGPSGLYFIKINNQEGKTFQVKVLKK